MTPPKHEAGRPIQKLYGCKQTVAIAQLSPLLGPPNPRSTKRVSRTAWTPKACHQGSPACQPSPAEALAELLLPLCPLQRPEPGDIAVTLTRVPIRLGFGCAGLVPGLLSSGPRQAALALSGHRGIGEPGLQNSGVRPADPGMMRNEGLHDGLWLISTNS